jgi:predicted ATPase
VLLYTLVGSAGAAKTSLVAYVSPAFAVVYGVVFLDESVGVGAYAGLALILAGSWLAAGGRLPVARRKLAAGGVDVAAAGEPDGGPQPVLFERRAERIDGAAR